MRIGYDAKWFHEGPPSGRVVVRAHLEAFRGLSHGHEIVPVLDQRHIGAPVDKILNGLECAWMWGDNNLIANVTLLPGVAKRLRLDALLAHNFVPPWSPCPSVAYVHDVLFLDHPQFYTWRERAYFLALPMLARRATRVCTVSETERERLAALGVVPRDRIDVAYHGVDEAFGRVPSNPATNTSSWMQGLPDQFVLFVGRLNSRKNVEALIRAVPHLRHGGVSVVLAGERDWKSGDARGLATELGLADRVRFLGAVRHDELPALYARASVFVFPSLAESFGLPPLEAMAAGVPCVVSNATSLPEVCGEAALFVCPTDHMAIASAVDTVLGDARVAQRLRDAGRRRAAEFSWARSAAAVLASLERAIGGP